MGRDQQANEDFETPPKVKAALEQALNTAGTTMKKALPGGTT